MIKRAVILGALVLASMSAAPALAEASSIPYNCTTCGSRNTAFDVTYSLTNASTNTYLLTIIATYQPAGAGTPDFTYLNDIAFELTGLTYETSPALLSGPAEDTWTGMSGGLAASGCNGSGATFYCAKSTGFGATRGAAGSTDTWTFSFDLPGLTQLHGDIPIHLKAHFLNASGGRAGGAFGADGTGFEVCNNGPCTTLTPTPVPEPASLLLLGLGLAGTAVALRRRKANNRV